MPVFFKPGEIEKNIPTMTGFVAEVRALLDRIGETRGRPYPLAVNVPDAPKYCLRAGLDIIMSEKEEKMNRILLLLVVALTVVSSSLTICNAEEAIEPRQKVMLFDGNSFDGWFRFLRNNQGDVDETWTIKPNGILFCKGEPRGYIRTLKSYKNYKLHFEYRWPARPVDGAINATTAHQARIGGIDDGVGWLVGYIPLHYGQRCLVYRFVLWLLPHNFLPLR